MDGLLALIAIALVGGLIVIPILILVRLGKMQQLFEESFRLQKRSTDGQDSQRFQTPTPRQPVISDVDPDEPPTDSQPPVVESSTDSAAKENAKPDDGVHISPAPTEKHKPLIQSQESTRPAPPLQTAQPSAFEVATRDTLRKIRNWILIGEEDTPEGTQMETALASQWLLRVGVLLLFAGSAYLMKYSIEHDLFSPEQRVGAGLLSGLLLMVGSHRIREGRYSLLRYGLMGSGIGILYISTLAATTFYHFLTPGLGFLAIAMISAISGFLSLRHNSILLAVIGIFGGYTTPLLLGLEAETISTLYLYLLFIAAGSLFVCSRRDWPVLQMISFLLHWSLVTYTLIDLQPEESITVMIFTVAYSILFSTLSFARHFRLRSRTTMLDMLILVFNAAAYTMAIFHIITLQYPEIWVAIATAGAALFYGIHAFVTWKTKRLDYQIYQLFCLLAGFFTLLTLPILISAEWMTAVWALTGLLVLIIGQRFEHPLAGRIGFGLLAFSTIRLLASDLPLEYGKSASGQWVADQSYWPGFLQRMLRIGIPIGCLVKATRLLWLGTANIPFEEEEDSKNHLNPAFFSTLRLALVGFLLAAVLLDVFFRADLVPDRALPILLLLLVASILIRTTAGFRNVSTNANLSLLSDVIVVGFTAIIAFNFAPDIVRVIGADRAMSDIVGRNMIWVVFLAAVIAALPILRPRWVRQTTLLGVTAFLCLFWATTAETHHALATYFNGFRDGGTTVMMIINAILLLILGIRVDYKQIRWAGLALIGFSMIKLYFHDLKALENIYRVVALVLMGILLIGGSTLYLRIRKSPDPSEVPADGDLSNTS